MNGPTWCALELFGHRQLAGLAEEVELAGVRMLRVEVPCRAGTETDREDWPPVRYFNGSALYSVTPVSEAQARKLAEQLQPRRWDAPQLESHDPDDEPAICEGCGERTAETSATATGWFYDDDCCWRCPDCLSAFKRSQALEVDEQ
jgi:hypothetical protein